MYLYEGTSQTLTFTLGMDPTFYDEVVLKYRDPLGEEGELSTTIVSVEDTTLSSFIEKDILTVGVWTFWSECVKDNQLYIGHQFQVEVKNRAATITTRDFVKKYTNIEDNDFQIDSLIPVIENDYLEIRGAPFDRDNEGNIVYPTGSNVTAAEMIEFRIENRKQPSAKSYRLGKFSITKDDSARGYPPYIVNQIKRYTVKAL